MKRVASILLSSSLLLSSVPFAGAVDYSDTLNHWAEKEIASFDELGLIQGYNHSFFPDKSITRGELAVIIDRMMAYTTSANNTFSDLDQSWYTEAVLKANAAGVILGSEGLVRPNDTITRQEAILMIARAMGVTDEEKGNLSQFSDQNEIADWAKDAAAAMVARGYIKGTDGKFRPSDSITRAEVVAILTRAMTRLVSAGETVTGKVDGTVLVRGNGATLKDMTIQGDLILAEGIGEGDVTLENVTIEGRTIVRGGGEHSILMNNVRANGGVVVNKLNGRVRIVTSGNSNISVTVLETGAILVGDGFDTVEIPADMAAGQTVELSGTIGRLVNNSETVSIKASGTIKVVEANVKTDLSGTKLTIKKTEGEKVTLNDKVVKPTGGSTNNSSGGSSGGGGGSNSGGDSGNNGGTTDKDDKEDDKKEDDSTIDTIDPNATYGIALDTKLITLKPNEGKQLKATTKPEGMQVYWVSGDTSIVSVSEAGYVTAKKEGKTSVSAYIVGGDTETYTAKCEVTVESAQTENPGQTTTFIRLNKSTLSLVPEDTYQLTATTNPTNVSVQWSSSDPAVATVSNTGEVTAVAKGSATITAQFEQDGKTYTATCSIKVRNAGWNDAEEVDSRFAPGYPLCSTDKDGFITMTVKVPSASESNPVEVYMVVNTFNSNYDADTTSVLHGHADDCVQADETPYIRLTDGEEHTISTHSNLNGNDHEYAYVSFVLKDSSGTSQTPTKIAFAGSMVAELDTSAPYISRRGQINEARDAIYLHSSSIDLDPNSIPAASAFTLTGVEGATVTGVSLTTAQKWNRTYYSLRLSVSGIGAAADLSNLKVTYTKPKENPIQDTATTPNQTEDFTCDVTPAKVSIDPDSLHISADGTYAYLEMEHGCYTLNNSSFNWTVADQSGTTFTLDEDNVDWSFSYDGSADFYFTMPDANWTGNQLTFTATPTAGNTDWAMDPITKPVTITGTMADSPLKIKSAVYKANEKKLYIYLDGTYTRYGTFGCNFQLSDGAGNSYTLRGYSVIDRKNNAMYLDLTDGYVTPEAGWKLTYAPQHEDMDIFDFIIEASGKPMANQTIDITIE